MSKSRSIAADQMETSFGFSSVNPGFLRKQDLHDYKAVKRSAVCGKYKTYQVCGMAPPSSGGINVLQILRLLEPFDMAQYQPNSLTWMNLRSSSILRLVLLLFPGFLLINMARQPTSRI